MSFLPTGHVYIKKTKHIIVVHVSIIDKVALMLCKDLFPLA